jgi:hypothetical protein
VDDFWETAVGIAFIALIWWGGSSVWNWAFGDSGSSSDYENSYSQPNSFFDSSGDCNEPENPYDEGSGHYAGWQWGEEGNYCSGNSSSFVEGCEDYEYVESKYEDCMAQ